MRISLVAGDRVRPRNRTPGLIIVCLLSIASDASAFGAASPSCVIPVSSFGGYTGIHKFFGTPDSLLVYGGLSHGQELRRYDRDTSAIVPIKGDAHATKVVGVHGYPGGALINTDAKLLRYDSHDNTIAQLGIGNYEFTAIHDLPTGALFVDDKLGLVRYDFQSKSIKPIGNKGQLSYSRSLFFHNVTRGVLVADENGLFLYDPLRDEIEPVAGGTNHGWVVGSYDVEDGVLVSFRNYDHASVYRYDPTKNSLTLVVDAPKAVARAKNNLDLNALNMIKVAGGMLVAGGDGLFKYDSGAHVFRPLNSKIADAEFHKINGGGVLVVAVPSFYYDENQETVSPVQSDPGLTWDSNPPAGPWYIPTPIVELFKTQACCALRYRRPRSHPRRQPSLFNILLHAQFQARVTDSQ